MRKYSRQHGWMILHSYASGDGSIHFTWISENDPQGPALSEYVTESDVSEYLREDEESGAHRWKGWEIFVMWPGRTRFPEIRLVEPAFRPFHTFKRLVFRGGGYEYSSMKGDGDDYRLCNTTFWALDEFGKHEVHNGDIRLALCFYLNHEEDFAKQGFTVRERRAGCSSRAVHGVGVPA